MKRILVFQYFIFVSIAVLGQNIALTQFKRNFAKPDRIRFDSTCLIINGKAQFIFSGSFHYFRCPRELWADRFKKIKEAGFNTVETYIPWNRHETVMPNDINDFSKINLDEFSAWLKMAEYFGFYIIVRPGPFICAEYDRGGYPGWLITKRPQKPKEWMWLRSDDPEYLEWSAHWMKAFCKFIAPHQVTRRKPRTGGIIMLQLENEFSHVYFPAASKVLSIKSLAQTALSNGIEVPMIACETPEISQSADPVLRNNIFETRNFYPGLTVKSIQNDIEKLRSAQPDAPLMVTELQGGWFPFVWNQQTINPDADEYPKEVSPQQIQNLTLYCLQNGFTLLNYYMLFGGTNLGGIESKDMQTSYDYGAPIRENGGISEKYQRVKSIGLMLKQHGDQLLTSVLLKTISEPGQKDVEIAVRQSQDGSRYVFIRNNDYKQSKSGKAVVKDLTGNFHIDFNYDLEPLGSKILYLPSSVINADDGEWLPKIMPGIKRPANIPLSAKITRISYAKDYPTGL